MSFSNGGGTLALPSPTHAHHMDVTSAVRSLRRSISRSPSKFLSRTNSQISVSSVRGNTTKAAHRAIATTDSSSGTYIRTRYLSSSVVCLDTPPTQRSTVSALCKVCQNINTLVQDLGARKGITKKSP
ncbi:hypothetical protein E4U41_002179 [Claviceps citrina]|nr:hypothetical protein E4U41_002179 [Claviceps citrina]